MIFKASLSMVSKEALTTIFTFIVIFYMLIKLPFVFSTQFFRCFSKLIFLFIDLLQREQT